MPIDPEVRQFTAALEALGISSRSVGAPPQSDPQSVAMVIYYECRRGQRIANVILEGMPPPTVPVAIVSSASDVPALLR